MTYVPRWPKKPVNITLSEDLVRAARSLTPNLSHTVEQLLADYVEAQQKQRAEKERLIDQTIEMAKAHYEEYGFWGEEFSTL